MLIYFIFFFVALYFFLSKNKDFTVNQFAIYFVVLCLFVALADQMGGYDRYVYGLCFDSAADVTGAGGTDYSLSAAAAFRSEYGYYLLNILLSHITANRYIFIFLVTVIIYSLLYASFRKYISNYAVGTIVFLGLWFFFTWTYLREAIGVAIGFFAYQYIAKRDWRRFYLLVFIAFMFHHSAFVLAPAYFIPLKKFPKNQVWAIMAVAFLLGFSPIAGGVASLLSSAADTERAQQFAHEMGEAGFRWDYLMEAFVFTYIITRCYKDIPDDKQNIAMLNMAFAFCMIILFFARSSSGGRLGWYYLMGIIATLTTIVTKERGKIPSIIVLGLCFLLFSRIVLQWGEMLYPYKTFLTSGHVCEGVYNYSEYDDRYDLDKFYRPAFWLR